MTSKPRRRIILAVVSVLIVLIVLWPLTPWASKGLKTTPNPADAYRAALAQGQPVFLEFYGAG